MGKQTEAMLRAKRKYEAKTYRRVSLYFRKDDDADLIRDMDDAKERGISNRQFFRSLYDKAKK